MTEAERDAEFDKAIAPLTRSQFNCMPLSVKHPVIARYLASIESRAGEPIEPDEKMVLRYGNQAAIRQFYKSTGPTPRCWKQGCEEPCEVDSWYCSEHTNHDPAPVAERVQWAKLGWRLYWIILAVFIAWLVGFIIALTGVVR